jgi:hypothetical protein
MRGEQAGKIGGRGMRLFCAEPYRAGLFGRVRAVGEAGPAVVRVAAGDMPHVWVGGCRPVGRPVRPTLILTTVGRGKEARRVPVGEGLGCEPPSHTPCHALAVRGVTRKKRNPAT